MANSSAHAKKADEDIADLLRRVPLDVVRRALSQLGQLASPVARGAHGGAAGHGPSSAEAALAAGLAELEGRWDPGALPTLSSDSSSDSSSNGGT